MGEEVGYMGASGNRECQRVFRSVLKDFTEDALTISVGNLFRNGTVLTGSCLSDDMECILFYPGETNALKVMK